MSKVKRGGGQSKAPPATLPPTIMTEKVSTYAFGTVVAGAVMVAAAAWMGGSLASIDDRLQSGFDVMADAAGFTVGDIIVDGLGPRAETEVFSAVGVSPGFNMFRADPYLLKDRIDGIESIASVRVLRKWPNEIWVVAEPREPLAVWQSDGEWVVVDQEGVPIETADPMSYAQLPHVVGPDGGKAAPELVEILDRSPEFAEKVATALRVGGRRWDLRLTNGVEIAMPEDGSLEATLGKVLELDDAAGVLSGQARRIDARDPERFAIGGEGSLLAEAGDPGGA